MKSYPLLLIIAAVISIVSCKKTLDINSGSNDAYSKWPVNTINQQSYLFPVGLTWDTTYAGMSTDYIDLSTKGEIVFYINQQKHTDTYDTTKYNLLKDTLVTVKTMGDFSGSYVALSNVTATSATLLEENFGIDTEGKTIYSLKK